MDVQFFTTFSKRNNSTKIPIGFPVTTKSCTLKDETSIENPILILRDELNFEPWQFSYCYIPKWRKYYYCSEPVWRIGTWEISCACDILGTRRAEIFNSNQYVTRCSAEYNGYISDMLYPATTETRLYSWKIDSPWKTAASAGSYVVGIISGDTAMSLGSTKYWVLSPTAFRNLMTYLLSDTFADYVSGATTQPSDPDNPSSEPVTVAGDLTADIVKNILNPIQYMVSCKWFPFDYDDMPGTAAMLQKFGWWNIVNATVAGKVLNPDNAKVVKAIGANMPNHPYTLARGEYMNFAPWTKVHLDFYPFDRIIIDPEWMIGFNQATGPDDPSYYVYMMLYVDLISGMGYLDVTPGGDYPLQDALYVRTTAQIGVDIALAQETNNIVSSGMNLVGGTMGGLATALAGGLFTGISQAVSGIQNALENALPQIQVNNVNGGMGGYERPVILSACFILPVEDNNTINGRPLCKWKHIGEYVNGQNPDPVFIQCANVQLSNIPHKEERDYCVAALETGVYLE